MGRKKHKSKRLEAAPNINSSINRSCNNTWINLIHSNRCDEMIMSIRNSTIASLILKVNKLKN